MIAKAVRQAFGRKIIDNLAKWQNGFSHNSDLQIESISKIHESPIQLAETF